MGRTRARLLQSKLARRLAYSLWPGPGQQQGPAPAASKCHEGGAAAVLDQGQRLGVRHGSCWCFCQPGRSTFPPRSSSRVVFVLPRSRAGGSRRCFAHRTVDLLAAADRQACPSARPPVHPTIVRPSAQHPHSQVFHCSIHPAPNAPHKVGSRPSCRGLPCQRSPQDRCHLGQAGLVAGCKSCLSEASLGGACKVPFGAARYLSPARPVPARHDVRSRPRAHGHLHHLLPPPCHRPAVNHAPPCATRHCRGWASEK